MKGLPFAADFLEADFGSIGLDRAITLGILIALAWRENRRTMHNGIRTT